MAIMENKFVRLLIDKKLVVFLCSLILIAICARGILLGHVEKTKFHGDESGWISSGSYYSHLLLDLDFDREKWKGYHLGAWGDMNTHVGKLLLGVPLNAYLKYHQKEDFSEFYDFNISYLRNVEEGRVPPRDILLRARAVSVFFGVLSCLLVFSISYFCANIWVAYGAILFLLTNNLFITSSTRALTDIFYNFFMLSFCAASIALLKRSEKKYMLVAGLLCGLLTGLACSVKVTGIVIGSAYFLILLAYKGYVEKLKKTQLLKLLIVFFLSAITVVYALNPCFWPNFRNVKIASVISESQSLVGEVVAKELPTDNRLQHIIEEYPQLHNLSRVLSFPYLFIRWNNFMKKQVIKRGEQWQGNRFLTFHKKLLIKYSTFFLGDNISVYGHHCVLQKDHCCFFTKT